MFLIIFLSFSSNLLNLFVMVISSVASLLPVSPLITLPSPLINPLLFLIFNTIALILKVMIAQ